MFNAIIYAKWMPIRGASLGQTSSTHVRQTFLLAFVLRCQQRALIPAYKLLQLFSFGCALVVLPHQGAYAMGEQAAVDNAPNPVVFQTTEQDDGLQSTQALSAAMMQLKGELVNMQALVFEGDHFAQKYIWHKAHQWIETGLDEAKNLNAGSFPIIAHEQASALIKLLQTQLKHVDDWSLAHYMPQLEGVPKVQLDLWDTVQLWHMFSDNSAPMTQYAARCALPSIGVLEVRLAHAGWVHAVYGKQSAYPYMNAAQRQMTQAEQDFIRCKQVQAHKQTALK